MTDTKALRELLAKATPGEWQRKSGSRSGTNRDASVVEVCKVVGAGERWSFDVRDVADFNADADMEPTQREANAECAVALHNAAPALLDEVEALRAEVADLRMTPGGLDKWQGVISAYVGEAREAAFREGAEKMREAAANACKTACDCNVQACWSGREVAADAIRALPLPEDNK